MMIAFESMSLIILGVIIVAGLVQDRSKDFKAKTFLTLSTISFVTIAADMGCFIMESFPGPGHDLPLKILFCIAIVGGQWIAVAYCYYITSYVEDGEPLSRWYMDINVILAIAFTVIEIVMMRMDLLYSIKDGVATYTDLYYLSYAIPVFLMAYDAAVIILLRKRIERNVVKVTLSFFISPIIGACLGFIDPDFSLSYVAVAISVYILFILLQSRRMHTMMVRGEIEREFSRTDSLTGLKNRRSYDETMDQVGMNHRGGVVYCDLNGLKYANDHYGHAAGDALLVKFSEMLANIFGHESVYRISGDEFTVILTDVSSDTFNERTALFRRLMAQNDGMAAVGAAYGSFENLNSLVDEAESAMYIDKEAYYKTHADKRR